ncbi:MAG: GDSL-type esterase/lipase family protein [Clostridium sp.]|nr:GDSL-type esterase/lipase family protein [Clostridium sp.]
MSIVCIGDSLTFGYGVKQEEGWVSVLAGMVKEKVINKGIPGNTTYEMKERFIKDVAQIKPSKVIIMGGTNDVFLKNSVKDVLHNIDKMIQMCEENKIIPIILTPLSVNGDISEKTWFIDMDYKEVNQNLSELRKSLVQYGAEKDIKVIDLGTILLKEGKMKDHFLNDGIHINKEVHSEIAEIVTQ